MNWSDFLALMSKQSFDPSLFALVAGDQSVAVPEGPVDHDVNVQELFAYHADDKAMIDKHEKRRTGQKCGDIHISSCAYVLSSSTLVKGVQVVQPTAIRRCHVNLKLLGERGLVEELLHRLHFWPAKVQATIVGMDPRRITTGPIRA